MDRGLFGTFDYDRDTCSLLNPGKNVTQLIGFSALVNGSM